MTRRHDAKTADSDTAWADSAVLEPIGTLGPTLRVQHDPVARMDDTGLYPKRMARPALVDTGDGITRPEDDVSS